MVQLMIQLIVTPLMNMSILSNKIKDLGNYFRVAIFAILLFLAFFFLTFNYANMVSNSMDLAHSSNVVDLFEITIPRMFQWFSSDAKS